MPHQVDTSKESGVSSRCNTAESEPLGQKIEAMFYKTLVPASLFSKSGILLIPRISDAGEQPWKCQAKHMGENFQISLRS